MWKLRLGRKYSKRQKEISRFVKETFGYKPGKLEVYELAFRHSSAAKKITSRLKNSNERLEFLGDAVLDIIVADYLYHKYPELPEGQLTKMKARVVSRKFLNVIGKRIHLDQLLLLQIGKQEPHLSIIGNAFEALVGAMYYDRGFDFTYSKVLKLFQQYKLDEKVMELTDFKSKLHEWTQKKKKPLSFKLLKEVKSEGQTFYDVEVYVDGKPLGRGHGKSKKTAEQDAAKTACSKIFTQ